jgi:glycerate kinase
MLRALGFRFLDSEGNVLQGGGEILEKIARIDDSEVCQGVRESSFTIACDVTNPLYGERGAAYVYAPQKGADAKMVEQLDRGLRNFARVVEEFNGAQIGTLEGAGAAGGLGGGFKALLGATLEHGITMVLEAMHFDKIIAGSDLVITGEGRLDSQSAMGKAPIGIAKEAKIHGKPVVAFSGCVADGAEKCNEAGIDAYFPILRRPVSLSEAMDVENAYKNLRDTAVQAFRLVGAVIDADR